ncbi:Cupredoxin [Russula vinacea]|nr:Cupredoxin [Russula vinacea]
MICFQASLAFQYAPPISVANLHGLPTQYFSLSPRHAGRTPLRRLPAAVSLSTAAKAQVVVNLPIINGILLRTVTYAGDSFTINVINGLTNADMDVVTSIHWHGLFLNGYNAADGGSMVNQCPIIPGNTFQYQFPVPDQAYCDGLRGAFIIRDPEDPQAGLYDVDDDTTIITLADWEEVSFTSSAIGSELYRFRLVSISCDPNWSFSIDNHIMTIIEVEGTNVQPLIVDQIQIYAESGVRAIPNSVTDNINNSTDGGTNSAILRYFGAFFGDPTTQDTSGSQPLVETNLHPLVPSAVPGNPSPGAADNNINLDVTVLRGPYCAHFAPDFVWYHQCSGSHSAGSIYGLTRGQVVEVTIPAGPGAVAGPHPVHLHGHSFYVVRSAGNSSYNWDNPIVRDVVNMGNTGDQVTIRFVADNPGPWFFHCHIDWHLAVGFAVVFAEDVPDVQSTDVPTADVLQMVELTFCAMSEHDRCHGRGYGFNRGNSGNLGAHPTANYGTLTLRRKGCTQHINTGHVSTSPKPLSRTQREELGGQFIADRDSVHARPRWVEFNCGTVQVETPWKTIRWTGRVRLGEVLRERADVGINAGPAFRVMRTVTCSSMAQTLFQEFSVTNVTLEGDIASYARTIFWQAGINASSTKPGGMSH